MSPFFFFFNDTATTEIYTLSLHDALPIWLRPIQHAKHRWKPLRHLRQAGWRPSRSRRRRGPRLRRHLDRKSTRLNSSHQIISYAVFCLKKKKTTSDTIFTDTSPTTSAERK